MVEKRAGDRVKDYKDGDICQGQAVYGVSMVVE